MDALPLSAYARVDTRDVDEAADEVGRIFCAHRLRALSGGAAFRARHHHCGVDVGVARAGAINLVAYGGDVSIDPGCLERFYLVQVPRAGSATIAGGARETETAPGRVASILSPTEPVTMRWSGSCAQLILLIERAFVERAAERLLDRPHAHPVVFATALDLERGIGRAVVAQMERLAALAEAGFREPARLAHMGEVLDAALATLLFGQPSDIPAVAGAQPRAPRRAVTRALEHIDANLVDGIDHAALAETAGVGLRALQAAFRRDLGRTIGEVVRARRLDVLHERLSDPAETRTVAALMLDVGLWHLGRAAEAYRLRFGEAPRETRARRR